MVTTLSSVFVEISINKATTYENVKTIPRREKYCRLLFNWRLVSSSAFLFCHTFFFARLNYVPPIVCLSAGCEYVLFGN